MNTTLTKGQTVAIKRVRTNLAVMIADAQRRPESDPAAGRVRLFLPLADAEALLAKLNSSPEPT